MILGVGLNVLVVAVIMLLAYLKVIKDAPYVVMSAPAYFTAGIIALLYSALYLFINRIVSIVKGDNLENEN